MNQMNFNSVDQSEDFIKTTQNPNETYRPKAASEQPEKSPTRPKMAKNEDSAN